MTASEAFPRRIFNGLQCQSALSYGDPMPKTPDKPPLSLVAGETAVISPPRPLGPHGASLWWDLTLSRLGDLSAYWPPVPPSPLGLGAGDELGPEALVQATATIDSV